MTRAGLTVAFAGAVVGYAVIMAFIIAALFIQGRPRRARHYLAAFRIAVASDWKRLREAAP